jgi:sugar phosphate isomerase/epimerase
MSHASELSRRRFLKLGATAAAACVIGGCKSTAPEAPAEGVTKRIPIGLQLYSVRGECEKDLPGTIAAVGKMGYEAVEFAGYYGRSAKELREMLDKAGLKCCGTHTGLDTLTDDKFQATVDFNKTLGNKFLIVPSLPEERRNSAQAWLDTAKLFNELSAKAQAQGMFVGYHNHNIEFTLIDGKLPWDLFFGNTAPEVVMQFDTGNAMQGGGEALPFLAKYPGRARTIHVKEYSVKQPKALVGDGDIPWTAIFKACETVGGTEWYIVEYESDAYPPLVSVEKCLANMKKMGK